MLDSAAMYIAMNKFRVIDGKDNEFEAAWRARDSYLDEVPGFLKFNLLRGDEGVFISHSSWESQQAFRDWTESEAFQKAHAQGSLKGILAGPPEFTGFEVVL